MEIILLLVVAGLGFGSCYLPPSCPAGQKIPTHHAKKLIFLQKCGFGALF